MCIVCLEFMKGHMRLPEARRAVLEIIMTSETYEDQEHLIELLGAVEEDIRNGR